MNKRHQPADRELTKQYADLLRLYLTSPREQILRSARDLGRRAFHAQTDLAALVTAHYRTLTDLAPGQARKWLSDRTSAPLKALLQGYGEEIQTMLRNQWQLESCLRRQRAELTSAGEVLEEEITERRLIEQALRDSEARFQAIFQRAGIGICLLDRDGTIRDSNLALREILGYDTIELHGAVLFNFVHPQDRQSAIERFRQLVQGRHDHYQQELRLLRKDGSTLWTRKIVSGVLDITGELQFVIDMIEDITESKNAELALRESEERFRQIANMTGEWIWEQDTKGRYLYSSAAVSKILGYRPEEIIGRHYYELFTPEDRRRIAPVAGKMMARKETFHNIINRYQHKDGHVVYTESSGLPILDDQGRVIKWRGVDHDVTERKRFEDALRLRDRAMEAASVGIIITDALKPGNPIIYANPAFTRITGYGSQEILGKSPGILQGPQTDPEAIEEIRRAVREGRDCHLTLINYRKDGTPFWNELVISPVRDETGRLTHFVGIQTDVTELRRIEEQQHELEIARRIQLSLLPPAPLVTDEVRVAGLCLPAAHVGGDYYDYYRIGETLNLVIADVSGHSVGAAMIMAETRSILKMMTHWRLQENPDLTDRVADNLALLNDLLFEDLNRSELFITMFYARYHLPSRRLCYANAGHNPPLLIRAGAELELDANGLVLGVMKGVTYEEKKLDLAPGDVLLLYTDGVTEARNKAGDFFGTSRLWHLFRINAHKTPREIIDSVVQELERFCQSKSFEDDISLLCLKIL